MKRILTTLFASFTGVLAADTPPKLYTIPSWGDYAVVYANGTDPAMDSQEGMDGMFAFWKARGFTGVFLRSDLQQYDPFVLRHGRSQMNPSLALMWRHIDVLGEEFDYFAAAQKAAARTGLQFWVYHPHIYSEGAPPSAGVEGPGRMVPWSYESKVLAEHPEFVTVDRRGNKYWMVPEYGYPEARSAKVAEFVHMARKYGIKHFIANLRSEVSQLQAPADKADRFGFNKLVADDMQRLHGVDIMTDPRFDIDASGFDPKDSMVEKWRDLRGGYLTQLWRELRMGLRGVDPKIELAITIAGEHVGPPLGNWRTDWRAWVDEGLVDYLMAPVFFEATLDHDAHKKGYLTNSRAGLGTVPHEVLKAYIKQSKHPEIQVIATGGPPYFFTPSPVPAGADGMQCDAWYGSYHRAWHQRWEQWQTDLREFGHIKFIQQSFDTVSPKDYAMPSGGWGNLAHDPQLRACPGAWWRLGDGSDAKPFAQSITRLGDTGQAMQLTRAEDGRSTLTGFHNSSPDRSKYAQCLDTSMTSGHAIFEFWLHRKTADSGIAAYLQGDPGELEVGVRIAPRDGKVFYSTGTHSGTGKWIETAQTLPVGEWHKLSIDVDIDHRIYSARIGDTKLCEHIPLTAPKERFVELPGVNIPIAVPVFKEFKSVLFVPNGGIGSTTYIDDVTVNWRPAAVFAEQGKTIEFSDDFESSNESIRDTSFGPGVKSLRLDGGKNFAAKLPSPLKVGTRVTLDVDLFLRSGEDLVSIMPNTATKFPHSTRISLSATASIMAKEGTWHLRDGDQWRDTKHPVHYDMWNHLQLALNEDGTYQAAAQPVGQVAAIIGTARGGAGAMDIVIEPSSTDGHVSCYDNVRVTSGRPSAE